jgi:hypothetical protein
MFYYFILITLTDEQIAFVYNINCAELSLHQRGKAAFDNLPFQ